VVQPGLLNFKPGPAHFILSKFRPGLSPANARLYWTAKSSERFAAVKNAGSNKNWIGQIQYFPAEADRRFSTNSVLMVWRATLPVSIGLHIGLSPLLLRRL